MSTMAPAPSATQLGEFVERFYAAVEVRDWETFRASVAEDATYLDERTGRWQHGRDPMLEQSREEIEGADRFHNHVEEVRPELIANDLGLVRYVWYADASWAGEEYHIRCPATLLARRGTDGWQIFLLHAVAIEDKAAGGADARPGDAS